MLVVMETQPPSGLRDDVAHLLRRAGFLSPASEVDRLAALGYDGAVDWLCDLAAPDAGADGVPVPTMHTQEILGLRRTGTDEERQQANDLMREDKAAAVRWWIERIIGTERPLREKLTFLWHDHFATSMEKVELAAVMVRQHGLLHRLGPGRFDTLVAEVARDPAMLIWLDGRVNTKDAPNENFARELFELFTLGHGGTAHGGHGAGQPYTERDIKEAARALAGWVIDPSDGSVSLDPRRVDTGTKTVLGETGALGLDDVVRLATRHPACAPHVVARLYSRLARPVTPDDPVVIELAEAYASDLDTTALLRRIFRHPDFLAADTRVALVKTPVEYVLGTVRALEVADVDERIGRLLQGLGQVPFFPPDVSGWPSNQEWLSTQSALVRLRLAVALGESAELPAVADAAPGDRADAVAYTLGVSTWSAPTAEALRSAASDPRRVLTVALASPEYLMN